MCGSMQRVQYAGEWCLALPVRLGCGRERWGVRCRGGNERYELR